MDAVPRFVAQFSSDARAEYIDYFDGRQGGSWWNAFDKKFRIPFDHRFDFPFAND